MKKHSAFPTILSLLGAVFCGVMAFWPKIYTDSVSELESVKFSTEIGIPTGQWNYYPEPGVYQSPIDFASLQGENPHIYAWLDIPQTELDTPLLQHDSDDRFYLKHDSLGQPLSAGAFYTEKQYNRTDFSDPVTLIYARNLQSAQNFGLLKPAYETEELFRMHPLIRIFLPDEVLHYRVFAAIDYDERHILDRYDFTKKEEFDQFLQTVFTAPGVFDDSITVNSRDHILILSTCRQWWSPGQRYLVLAKRLGDAAPQPDPELYVPSPERTPAPDPRQPSAPAPSGPGSPRSDPWPFSGGTALLREQQPSGPQEQTPHSLFRPGPRAPHSPRTFDPVPLYWMLGSLGCGCLSLGFAIRNHQLRKQDRDHAREPVIE